MQRGLIKSGPDTELARLTENNSGHAERSLDAMRLYIKATIKAKEDEQASSVVASLHFETIELEREIAEKRSSPQSIAVKLRHAIKSCGACRFRTGKWKGTSSGCVKSSLLFCIILLMCCRNMCNSILRSYLWNMSSRRRPDSKLQ